MSEQQPIPDGGVRCLPIYPVGPDYTHAACAMCGRHYELTGNRKGLDVPICPQDRDVPFRATALEVSDAA